MTADEKPNFKIYSRCPFCKERIQAHPPEFVECSICGNDMHPFMRYCEECETYLQSKMNDVIEARREKFGKVATP